MLLGSKVKSFVAVNRTVTKKMVWGLPLSLLAVHSFGAPSFTAMFEPNNIGVGSSSTIIYTIDNSSLDSLVTELTFANNLPAGVAIASPANVISSCANTHISAPDGGSTISLSSAGVGASLACTIQVDITGITSSMPGSHDNVTGDLTSSDGNSGAASASLTVDPVRPGFSKSFSPSAIEIGQTSTLTYYIDSGTSTTGIASLRFSEILPAGVVIATPANAQLVDCALGANASLTFTADAGTDYILFQSMGSYNAGNLAFTSLSPGVDCTLSVDVTSTTIGSFNVISRDFEYDPSMFGFNQNAGFSTANLSASRNSELFMSAAFADIGVAPGATTTLSYTLTNFDRSNTAGNLAFTNDLDVTLTGLTAVIAAGNKNECGGSLTVGSQVIYTGGNLAGGSSCTVDVDVTVPAAAASGSYVNQITAITSDLTAATTSANSLVVSPSPKISMQFLDDPANGGAAIVAGGDVTVRYTLENSSQTTTATNITFTTTDLDVALGQSLTITPMTPVTTITGDCGADSEIAVLAYDPPPPNDAVWDLNFIKGELAPGASCTFDVLFTGIDAAAVAGTFSFSSGAIIASIGGETYTGQAVSDELTVVAGPAVRMSVDKATMRPGDTLTASFTIDNVLSESAGSSTVSDLAFSLALTNPVFTASDTSNFCGAGSILSFSAGAINISGVTLAVDTSCSFNVALVLDGAAAYGNYTLTTGDIISTVDGVPAVKSSAVSADIAVSDVVLSLALSQQPLVLLEEDFDGIAAATDGVEVELVFSFNNPSTVAMTELVFSMELQKINSAFTAVGPLATAPCGADSALSGTTTLGFQKGELAAGDSCSFSVFVNTGTHTQPDSYPFATAIAYAKLGGVQVILPTISTILDVEMDARPSATLTTSASDMTGASPITFAVDFFDDVFLSNGDALTAANIDEGKIVITNGLMQANSFSGSGSQYSFNVIPFAAGEVKVQIAEDFAFDSAVQGNTASVEYSLTYDDAQPDFSIGVPVVAGNVVSYPLTYTLFDDVALTDRHINVSETTLVYSLRVDDGTTNNPTVVFYDIYGDGDIGFRVVGASAQAYSGAVAGESKESLIVTMDSAPSVSITALERNPTARVPAVFVVTYDGELDSKPAINITLAASDISLTGDGVTVANIAVEVIDAHSRRIVLSGLTGTGTIGINIAAATATDEIGNEALAASSELVTLEPPRYVFNMLNGGSSSYFLMVFLMLGLLVSGFQRRKV
ncbi:MAG: hypothetical protein HRU20_25945 [Pseudomonadales bacterium]|nr:hypothetical protein [Pseudomonadales bacterium]